MNLFQIVLLNSIYLIFPLILYLLYQVYSKTLVKEKNELFLDIAIISSFYLIIQYGVYEYNCISLLLLNIPLVIAYLKKRYITIIFLSSIIIIYYNEYLNFSIVLNIIEYLAYFLIYLFLIKRKLHDQIYFYIIFLVKSLCFSIQYLLISSGNEIISLFVALLIFHIEIFCIIQLFKKSEDILKLYKTIQELQDEKQVRESLFKITHEIKNPIAVCKGYLDMFDVNNLEHSRKYVPIIKSEIERILILLEDFLSITKVKVVPDIIDINLLLEEVIDSFKPLIADRKIEIVSNIKDDELYIMADYNRLSQVFVNIIKNSIEALTGITDGKIELSVNENKSNIVINISDNGCGISAEDMKRMNEPFFTTKSNGTGLGVYLSTEIIKAHGGTIRYMSEGRGVSVDVILPNKKDIKIS